uniref:Uncharacterized protein n=1 Tax=Knipowitschia caucasica TaxID=637954 RepID=A0AAV2MQL8_KNICA
MGAQTSLTTARVEELLRKVDDLENRARRSNIRLVGLPESKEGLDMCVFLERWIPTTLGERNFPQPLVIERAHRVGRMWNNGTASGSQDPTVRPRAVVMKLLNYADKVRIMNAARSAGNVFVDGRKVMFFPDLSSELLKKRKLFDAVKRDLAGLKLQDLRYGLVHPATLLVTIRGRRHTFEKAEAAETFVRRLRQERSGTSAEDAE